jgi:hypothetical protein
VLVNLKRVGKGWRVTGAGAANKAVWSIYSRGKAHVTRIFPEKGLKKDRFFRNVISLKSGLSRLIFDIAGPRITIRGGAARNQTG